MNRTAGRKWRYTTLLTTRIVIDFPIDETIAFCDRKGKEWMRLSPTTDGRTLKEIREKYSWDGATWVPDFRLHLETLNHDTDYQFIHTEHFPFSRRECDDAFLDLMKLGGRRCLGTVYWRGVRMFGGAFGRSRNGEWSKIITCHSVG